MEQGKRKLLEALDREDKSEGGDMCRRILLTLEVGKLEARHQDYRKPMLYFKEYDEFGFVRSVRRNPHYGPDTPLPQTDFSIVDLRYVRIYCGVAPLEKVYTFLTASRLEKEASIALGYLAPEEVSRQPPPVRKEFEESGWPKRFEMNWGLKRTA